MILPLTPEASESSMLELFFEDSKINTDFKKNYFIATTFENNEDAISNRFKESNDAEYPCLVFNKDYISSIDLITLTEGLIKLGFKVKGWYTNDKYSATILPTRITVYLCPLASGVC